MSAYEQLKDDLGYPQLGHAAETFATLAETATTEHWTHIQFLAHLRGDQSAAPLADSGRGHIRHPPPW